MKGTGMRYVRWLLFGLVAGLPGKVWAQGALIHPAYYALTGAPFTATVKAEWDGTISSRPGESYSLVYRDGAGRQRFETAVADSVRVTIYDPVKAQVIELSAKGRTAWVTAIEHVGNGGAMDLAARRGFPCHAAKGWTALGVREFAGLEACGQKEEGRELWLSTAYLMPLMSVTDDAQKGRLTQTVVKLVAGEPDARLFVIPAAYKVELRAPSGERDGLGNRVSGGNLPVLLHSVEPEYSPEALRAAQAGGLVIGLTVDATGVPTNVHVIRGAGHGADEAAIDAVRKYRFKPAMRDGKAVSFEMKVEVSVDPL